jgi:hypothetical protein
MRAVWTRLAMVALAIGLAAAMARPAAAQLNPFRSSFATSLTNDDFQDLSDAASRLLGRDKLTAGATEAWRNPQTGAGGTVEVARSFAWHGYGCHALRYTVLPNGPAGKGETRTVLNWCKTPAGWKIVSLR